MVPLAGVALTAVIAGSALPEVLTACLKKAAAIAGVGAYHCQLWTMHQSGLWRQYRYDLLKGCKMPSSLISLPACSN